MSFIILSLSIVYTHIDSQICVWFPHMQNPENGVKVEFCLE